MSPMDGGPAADEGFPRLEPDRDLVGQRIRAIPTGRVRYPLVLHRFREEHVVLERRAPPLVASRDEFVALVVDQREEHAHSVPLRESPRVLCLDLLPADSFDLLGVSLRAVASALPLRKVRLPGSPPGRGAVP